MTHRLILYFEEGLNTGRPSFTLFAGETPVDKGTAALDALATRLNGIDDYSITLVIPGEQVTTLVAGVPEGSRRHLKKALPYLLEDDLAAPVETLHIASLPKTDDEGGLLCAVIDKQLVDGYIGKLDEYGLTAARLFPDYWALPKSDKPQLAKIKHRFILRLPSDEGLALSATADNAQLMSLLPGLSGITPAISEVEPGAMIDGIPFNLLQGEYAPAGKNDYFALFRPAAIAVGICLLVFVGYFLGAGFYFNAKSDELLAESTQRYRELFPDDQRIIDLRRQMQAHLNNNNTGQSGSAFLQMLNVFSTAKQSLGEESTVRNIRFDQTNGTLQLELQTHSLNYAGNLQRDIQERGITAEVLSANTNGEGVIARLRLQAGAGQ